MLTPALRAEAVRIYLTLAVVRSQIWDHTSAAGWSQVPARQGAGPVQMERNWTVSICCPGFNLIHNQEKGKGTSKMVHAGQMKLYAAPCDLFVVMQQFAWQRACTERARRRHRAHILPRVTTQTGSGASQGRASCELFEAQYNAYREAPDKA